jgi:hypothetical protein
MPIGVIMRKIYICRNNGEILALVGNAPRWNMRSIHIVNSPITRSKVTEEGVIGQICKYCMSHG